MVKEVILHYGFKHGTKNLILTKFLLMLHLVINLIKNGMNLECFIKWKGASGT